MGSDGTQDTDDVYGFAALPLQLTDRAEVYTDSRTNINRVHKPLIPVEHIWSALERLVQAAANAKR